MPELSIASVTVPRIGIVAAADGNLVERHRQAALAVGARRAIHRRHEAAHHRAGGDDHAIALVQVDDASSLRTDPRPGRCPTSAPTECGRRFPVRRECRRWPCRVVRSGGDDRRRSAPIRPRAPASDVPVLARGVDPRDSPRARARRSWSWSRTAVYSRPAHGALLAKLDLEIDDVLAQRIELVLQPSCLERIGCPQP